MPVGKTQTPAVTPFNMCFKNDLKHYFRVGGSFDKPFTQSRCLPFWGCHCVLFMLTNITIKGTTSMFVGTGMVESTLYSKGGAQRLR